MIRMISAYAKLLNRGATKASPIATADAIGKLAFKKRKTLSVFVVMPFLRRYGCLFTYDQFPHSVSPAASITQWKNNTPAVMSGYSVHTVVAKGTSTINAKNNTLI